MKRPAIILLAAAGLSVLPQFLFSDALHAIAASVAAVCLVLWLTEAVPAFVPTLLLWASVPALLGAIDPKFGIQPVLGWAADPVMALFFGGFVLGAAAESTGLAARLMGWAMGAGGASYRRFLLLVILATAFLSMWMSNIAAAALVLACLAPVTAAREQDDILRRLLLVGVALGADLGGIATPIGTGPNAIAIAAISARQPVSFVSWMVFALPLTVGALIASYLLLARRIPRGEVAEWRGACPAAPAGELASGNARSRAFLFVLAGTVALWLTEPFHGIPAAVVSVAGAAIVFAAGILDREALKRLDWSTLLLIAGGITLGRLLEQSGLVRAASENIPFESLHPTASLFLLCLASAVLSALMSNTATAVLLIPLASAIVPEPSTAILIAIAASFGIPFVVSTPPNAMAFGQGGLRFGDLFWPGAMIMIGGCLLISLTGRPVLRLAGIE